MADNVHKTLALELKKLKLRIDWCADKADELEDKLKAAAAAPALGLGLVLVRLGLGRLGRRPNDWWSLGDDE